MIRRVFQSFQKPERDLALSSPSHAGDPVPFQRGVSHAGLRIDEAPSYTSSFADPTHAPEIGVMRQTTMPSATLHLKQTGSQGLDILYDPPSGLSPAVDIVFIHGLTGNSYNTWCYSNDLNEKYDIYWPQHLLKFDIPDARILSFGYDANVVGLWSPASTNGVANHAENLLGHVTRLRERTNSEDRALIFVMHSLGGLVVQNAIRFGACALLLY